MYLCTEYFICVFPPTSLSLVNSYCCCFFLPFFFFFCYSFGCLTALIFPILDISSPPKNRRNGCNENFCDFHTQVLMEGS